MQENEIKLTSKAFLVTETDQDGNITFANDEFCHYSERSLEELIGQPHNIVRHPDMPKIIFEEMWRAIKSENKWRGFIKNKTAKGKCYWVFATVYPFVSCNGTKGFISCRRKAAPKEIEKYEKLYKGMK